MPYESNRASRQLEPAEISRVMSDREAEIIEWPIGGLTFVCSRRYMAIIRAGALGGDQREIHGGMLYPNDIAYLLDVREIKMVPQNVQVK